MGSTHDDLTTKLDDFSTSDIFTLTQEHKMKDETFDQEKQLIDNASWYIEGLKKRLNLYTIRLIVEQK